MSIPEACVEAYGRAHANDEEAIRRVILALAGNMPADALEKSFEQAQREASELPDRTSPDDKPDMLLVSVEELDAIILGAVRTFLNHVAGDRP